MTLTVEEEVQEGLFQEIPAGKHLAQFPLSKLSFYDRKDKIIGGSFTADIPQTMKEGEPLDGLTFHDIKLMEID